MATLRTAKAVTRVGRRHRAYGKTKTGRTRTELSIRPVGFGKRVGKRRASKYTNEPVKLLIIKDGNFSILCDPVRPLKINELQDLSRQHAEKEGERQFREAGNVGHAFAPVRRSE